MHQVLALLITALFSCTMFACENTLKKNYPFEKAVLLLLPSNNTLNRDINSKIGYVFAEMINKELDLSLRIKMLHYFAHTSFHNFFNMIYQPDEKMMNSIACSLFKIPQDKLLIDHRTALYRGDFLAPHEYSTKDTREKILFLKYFKADNAISDETEAQYMAEILNVTEGEQELNVTTPYESYGIKSSKIYKMIFSGYDPKPSAIVRGLLLRTSFSLQEISKLFNIAVIMRPEHTFLNELLAKFIHKRINTVEKKRSYFGDCLSNFSFINQEKQIDDRCRFIVLFTLLLHHGYIPESYMIDYVDILLNNINEFFPTTIKPAQSLCGYIDHLHGTQYEPTALHYACKFTLFNLINLILQKDDISISLNKQNHEGKTPLMLLCKYYFPYDLYGLDNYLNSKSSLSKKIEVFIDIMKQCINKGADISIRDNKGKTIVHHIFENIFGRDDARHSNDEDLLTPLFCLLNFLKEYIPTFMNQKDNNNNTPFHFFISNVAYMKFSKKDTIKLIHYFLSGNNNVSHPNKKNRTPLQMYLGSIVQLNWDIICFLISQGSTLYWPHTETKIEIDYSRRNKGPLMYSKKFRNQMPFKTIVSFINEHAYIAKPEEYQLKIEEKIESHIKAKENEWKQLLGPLKIDMETFKKKQFADVLPQNNSMDDLKQEIEYLKKSIKLLKEEILKENITDRTFLTKYFSFFFKLFRLSFFLIC